VSDVDFAQIFIRMASLPMSYVVNKDGKRVRLLPDFYITRLRPVARWEGVIIGTTESLAGQTTKYRVRLDERFQSKEQIVDATDEEMEEC
jgi:hypothetical protein